MDKLNARQRKFIQGLMEGKTQTQAYIEAGYSEKYARQNAHRLTTNDYILGIMEKLSEERRIEWKYRLDAIVEDALDMLPKMIKLGTAQESPRVAAINLALKYAGLEPPKRTEHSGEVKGDLVVQVISAIPRPEDSEDCD